MRSATSLLIVAISSVTFSACASAPRANAPKAPVLMAVTSAPTHASQATPPAGIPTSGPTVRHYTPDRSPMPVFTNAVIEEWDVEAHVNEKGELVGPTKKWTIKEAPKWNVDALRNPDAAYIPAENLAGVPGRSSYTGYSISAEGTAGRPVDSSIPAWATAEGRNIKVLGVLERSQQAIADEMCSPDEVAVWDETGAAGYLAVPKALLSNTGVKRNPARSATSKVHASGTAFGDTDIE